LLQALAFSKGAHKRTKSQGFQTVSPVRRGTGDGEAILGLDGRR
jgi:hypothetical protein